MLGQASERKSRQILPSAAPKAGGQGRMWDARDISSSLRSWESARLRERKEILHCRQPPPTNLGILLINQAALGPAGRRGHVGRYCPGNAFNREFSSGLSFTS